MSGVHAAADSSSHAGVCKWGRPRRFLHPIYPGWPVIRSMIAPRRTVTKNLRGLERQTSRGACVLKKMAPTIPAMASPSCRAHHWAFDAGLFTLTPRVNSRAAIRSRLEADLGLIPAADFNRRLCNTQTVTNSRCTVPASMVSACKAPSPRPLHFASLKVHGLPRCTRERVALPIARRLSGIEDASRVSRVGVMRHVVARRAGHSLDGDE